MDLHGAFRGGTRDFTAGFAETGLPLVFNKASRFLMLDLKGSFRNGGWFKRGFQDGQEIH